MKKWQCILCGFVYDEAAGLPDEGIAPGTRWEDVPARLDLPLLRGTEVGFRHDCHFALSGAATSPQRRWRNVAVSG